MPFIRLRGNKALLLHSIREGSQVRQVRLHSFDKDHPFTELSQREIERAHPDIKFNWDQLSAMLPPSFLVQELEISDDPPLPEEDLTVGLEGEEGEDITLEEYARTKEGYLYILEYLSEAAPSPLEKATLKAILLLHNGKKPFDLLRAVVDALAEGGDKR